MARAPFTYDGVNHTHGHLPSTPGSAAIPTSVDTAGLTALHEFGHASSDFNNGQVIDLYVDGLRPGFLVNKKARAQATDPVPASFATYNGTTSATDPSRDSIGYSTTWTSYHPELACGLADRGELDLPLLGAGRAGRRSALRSTADLLELRWPGRRDRPTHRALGPQGPGAVTTSPPTALGWPAAGLTSRATCGSGRSQ